MPSKYKKTALSEYTSNSEFVRKFIRRHVAPQQRVQADLSMNPDAKFGAQNINLAPQTTTTTRRSAKARGVNKSQTVNRSASNGTNQTILKRCRQRRSRQPLIFNKPKTPESWQVPGLIPLRLHRLWLGYSKSLINWDRLLTQSRSTPLASASQTNHMEIILRMNLIGALLHVIRSNSTCLAGRKGIVVMETKQTIRIALLPSGRSNPDLLESVAQIRLHSIPKAGSLFALEKPFKTSPSATPSALPDDDVVLLNGEQLVYRLVDRATRKWRRPVLSVPLAGQAIPSVTELWTDLLDSYTFTG